MYNVLKSFYHKSNMSEWVSEWLLFNAKRVIFQLIVRISYIQWDDDDVCFVLDQHAQLDFYSPSSVKQQSASRYVTPLGHIILILNQPVLLLLLNTACLVDKHNINFIVFGFTQSGIKPMIYRTWGKHANHYTTNL